MNTVIFCLAFLGIGETGYLILKRLARRKPICSQKLSCSLVLESPYKKTFGIENDLLGLLFYSLVISISLIQMVKPELGLTMFTVLYKLVITTGVGFTFYFLYIQWQKIKTWCLWCLCSASLVFSMAGLILVR